MCAGFNVSTLTGSFALPPFPERLPFPVVIMAYDPTDAASQFMWTSDNSLRSFLRSAPEETRYLFLSYGRKHSAGSLPVLSPARHRPLRP